MSKTVSLRLSDDDYRKIYTVAKNERRPISNFITYLVISRIDESFYADPSEMRQTASDGALQKKLKAGHRDAKKMKGKLT